MTKLSSAEVRKLAALSRIKLTEEEVRCYQNDLSTILNYVEILQKVNVVGLEPTSQVTGLMNVVRADEEIDYGTTPDELLINAPAVENRQFKVKRIIE
jgi:aspartyl-tRNA(Asn)/glutamyl-tRNA(Gln) amidotransferase subunit C